MGLDPQKHVSKTKLILTGIIYKLKVIISTIVIKKILKAVLPRVGGRGVIIPFVGVFIVAFWDAYIINKSIKDARLRLFGYYFSRFLIDEVLLKKMSGNRFIIDIEGAIRAIASIMVLSKSNHPNNLILLIRLSKYMDRDIDNADSLDEYIKYLSKLSPKQQKHLKLLSTIVAIFDGKITKEEKEGLIKIYQEDKEHYLKLLNKMKKLLRKGHIHKLANLVLEEFNSYS
jgi:hypothetical protein